MNFYNSEEIKQNADCLKIARDVLNLPVSDDGRCAATWRNGDNKTSVSINKRGWHDFATDESGSVIDLVMKVKNMDFLQAQDFLGEHLKLTPEAKTAKGTRIPEYNKKIAEGYREVAHYDYCDLQGNVVFQKIRLEHPEKGKSFVQKTPTGWGLKGIVPILYNLKNLHESPWAIIVEGEKDADNLISLGLPATTNFDGAGKWRESYNQEFDGKDVVILPDNDDPGRKHANLIATNLLTRGKAKSIKIVPTSNAPKGDVSDFFAEGHTWQEVQAKIAATPAITPGAPADSELAVAAAKQANQVSFRNFTTATVDYGEGKKEQKTPRPINDLIAEVHLRFLNFPRKVGEFMFDHDRDTGEIVMLDRPAKLFSWIQRKSKHCVEWNKDVGCVTKDEMFEGLHSTAKRYEAISTIPDWPRRSDVYYSCGELPAPDPEYKRFNQLLDCFALADAQYRPLLATLIAAPLFYSASDPRPLWIIDSADGAGSGKTTLVKKLARLYNSDPIDLHKNDLKNNIAEVNKRLISSEARKKRIVLLDNITGDFSCSELAELVTKSTISGRPAYGRGEETRPNNLTYIITANSASVDNDLAARAFYLMLRKAEYSECWERDLDNYIEKHRMEIFSDIIDLIEKRAKAKFNLPPQTRYPGFECTILRAFCRDEAEYRATIELIAQCRTNSNSEGELAQQIEVTIMYQLRTREYNPDTTNVFIPTEVLKHWLKEADITLPNRNIAQAMRNMAVNGLLPKVDKKTERYPARYQKGGPARRRGILWYPTPGGEVFNPWSI